MAVKARAARQGEVEQEDEWAEGPCRLLHDTELELCSCPPPVSTVRRT